MESFAKNIARGVNTHISNVSGVDASVMLRISMSGKTMLEIVSMEKKLRIDLDTNEPEKIVERTCEILKNIDMGIIEHGEPCHEIYYFIERDDITYLKDIFILDNIKFDFDKCAVCYCASVWETSCKHSLCMVCLPRCKTCPLCRRSL